VLRNAQGEPFEFEYLSPREGGNNDWQMLLKKLGITMKERVVDFALYRTRLEKYDYDMIALAGAISRCPTPARCRRSWARSPSTNRATATSAASRARPSTP